MYGLVNQAIEDMVRTGHGDEVWDRISTKAGFTAGSFIRSEPYPDDITFALVGAACEEFGAEPDDLLEAFGKYWILYTGLQGYGSLFASIGDTLPEFLAGLDAMHARIAVTMPEARMPSFSVREIGAGIIEVEYASSRDGLAPLVLGMLKGLGEVFQTTIDVAHCEHLGPGRDRFSVAYEANSKVA